MCIWIMLHYATTAVYREISLLLLCHENFIPRLLSYQTRYIVTEIYLGIIKRPARDACLCMGELQAPPAPHFVFLITL